MAWLEQNLEPGEKVLYRYPTEVHRMAKDWLIGLAWLVGFLPFIAASVITGGFLIPMLLFFVAAMVLYPSDWRHRNWRVAVTDRRLLVNHDWLFGTLGAMRLEDIERVESSQKHGAIVYGHGRSLNLVAKVDQSVIEDLVSRAQRNREARN